MLPPIKGRRKKSLEYSTNGSSVSPTANALESVLSGVPETAWNSDADIKGHDAHASGKVYPSAQCSPVMPSCVDPLLRLSRIGLSSGLFVI